MSRPLSLPREVRAAWETCLPWTVCLSHSPATRADRCFTFFIC